MNNRRKETWGPKKWRDVPRLPRTGVKSVTWFAPWFGLFLGPINCSVVGCLVMWSGIRMMLSPFLEESVCVYLCVCTIQFSSQLWEDWNRVVLGSHSWESQFPPAAANWKNIVESGGMLRLLCPQWGALRGESMVVCLVLDFVLRLMYIQISTPLWAAYKNPSNPHISHLLNEGDAICPKELSQWLKEMRHLKTLSAEPDL